MTLILYGAPLSPFVRKAEVVLREKGIPFESESVNILPMPDWFKAISPARRIPVLRDTSIGTEGRAGTLPDSSAILSTRASSTGSAASGVATDSAGACAVTALDPKAEHNTTESNRMRMDS